MTGVSQHDSGLLLVDKPQGVTSHDVVAAVRSALHMKKVGHAGTLDPMATGMLVIGFGYATRLLNYLVEHSKTYEATIRLGQSTTTDDAEGDIVSQTASLSPNAIALLADAQGMRLAAENAIRKHFLGDIEQVPSSFSAIKIHGQRAYDLARSGEQVELQARPITISEFEVLDVRQGIAENEQAVVDLDVRVSCSSGTYIRALARDLGAELLVGGHLTRLRRIRVGRFDIQDSKVLTAHTESRLITGKDGSQITRNKIVLECDRDTIREYAIPMLDSVKRSMNTIEITDSQAQDLRYGRRIAAVVGELSAAYMPHTGDVVAIIEADGDGMAKPVTVFTA
ncbi:tRNA pseudouridine(55) synthase TruB [Bifidobacterium tsurumiense]|uniref:tRNA pseudouridine synthase B n=1 Tax=Bifidobacterium tsurumiense TaxID=356829 RepID=A0A087EC79_9BIFI|nr:tRNA pseudouridine(55) synthase TruB [Bifidobacterium tsurumiense]KFJ05380.1 tRNA pseudouridine synthase B [Bifidobacterium tsurumiense]MDY4678120.1 tRNA pseudouridine(55) synthase TruB [Bifidobacterium tsurumiense]